jgi:hypothetical protein
MSLRSQFSSTRFSKAITTIILAVWLGLLGLLLWDVYIPATRGPADGLHLSATESDDWFIIRIGGTYSGFGRSRQYRKENQWILHDELNISLNIQGQVKPVRIANESTVDESFRLVDFRLKVSSGIMSFEQKGRMEGRDLMLEIPASAGGGNKRIKLAEVPRIARSLGLPIPLTGLSVGDEFRLPLFDPLDGSKWDVIITVLEKADLEITGRKIESWRVRAIYRTMDLSMWIDDQGRLLKGRMPLGITVIRSDKDEIAREMKSVRELPDMASLACVPVQGELPSPERLQRLRLKISGGSAQSVPSDGLRQQFKNSEILLTRESLPAATYQLPCVDDAMREFLQPSRFIRSDDSSIVERARGIVGDEKNPVRVARLINKWVHDYLKKVPTPAIPDAVAVLESRQGDCNEHAVLAAALARAVGLPARLTVGLVYTEDGFCYHAWVDYWAGNRWFTGDPLMNLMPVGPTHISLVHGDVDKHMNVISYLGQLRLQVIEAE